MFGITFDKLKSQRFFECLAKGEPIGVARTVNDFVALGGACFAAILSHGPALKKALAEMKGLQYSPPSHPEHAEASDEEIMADAHAAIEFGSMLTFKIHDGDYDEDFEPIVMALVSVDDKGGMVMTPISGFRKLK